MTAAARCACHAAAARRNPSIARNQSITWFQLGTVGDASNLSLWPSDCTRSISEVAARSKAEEAQGFQVDPRQEASLARDLDAYSDDLGRE